MLPMAMPPHYGGGHPPLMHSAAYSNVSANPHGGSQHFPVTTSSHVYNPSQNSTYVNPYNSQPYLSQNASTYSSQRHPHMYNQHDSQTLFHSNNFRMSNPAMNSRQEMCKNFLNSSSAYNPKLFDKIEALHLGYIETEDSPQKMEQRHKMEELIHEYLGITPHSYKFNSIEVKQVLENSINTKSDFDPHKASCAFDALAQFAANLIVQPWRTEFRELKVYSGFWVHQVGSHLVGAESILEVMGYVAVKQHGTFKRNWSSHPSSIYVHTGVLDPDLICRLALDCMIAYCECQCLKRIREGVSEFGLSVQQILQFRQVYIGDVDVGIRHLLHNSKQKMHTAQRSPPTENLLNISVSPPPIPARQNSSYNATAGKQFSKRTPSPSDNYHNQSRNSKPKNTKSVSKYDTVGDPSKKKTLSMRQISESSTSHTRKKSDEGELALLRTAMNSCQVPTAKLIDIDSSHDNSHKSSKPYVPKSVPHKSRKPLHGSREILNDQEALSVPPISPDSLKLGTLEEHLEASLNIAKNSTKHRVPLKTEQKSSLDSWDFVYKNLEKKGYVKDIGDRGDILNNISKVDVPNHSSKNKPPAVDAHDSNVTNKSDKRSSYDNVEGQRHGQTETTWSCKACTFLNMETRSICEMCGKSRIVTNDTLQSGGKQCTNCTLINDREAIVCSACGSTLTGCSTYI